MKTIKNRGFVLSMTHETFSGLLSSTEHATAAKKPVPQRVFLQPITPRTKARAIEILNNQGQYLVPIKDIVIK